MSNTKKFLVGGVIVVVLGGYALWSASRSGMSTPAPAAGQTSAATSDTQNGSGSSAPASTGTYKDGTYTGSVGDAAPYGQVQVDVTVTGGKIASIAVVQSPSGPGHTNDLTASTFPILIQEAIVAQSAKVNIVSGATQDSQGFQQSLGSALVQAQA